MGFLKKKEPTDLDLEIARVASEMRQMQIGTPEYFAHVKTLKELNQEKPVKGWNKVDINTVITVVGTLVGVAGLAAAERASIISKNALSHLHKLKL